jgi:hypothetical protein
MSTEHPPRARSAWAVTADLATIALVARLAVVVYALAEPVWDGHYYDLGARRIAAGLGYSEELRFAGPGGSEQVVWQAWAHYPVGYSGFLALFFRLFGGSIAVPPLANALTGAALAAVAHRLARHAFGVVGAGGSNGATAGASRARSGEIRALIAGLLVALHPGLVLYSGALMTEPLAALGMLSAILWSVADRSRVRASIGAGVLLGLTTLVRPNAMLLAPFLVVGELFVRDARWPKRIGLAALRGALVAAFALATVAPWTYRNCKQMDACAMVSTNAGWNLVIGSAPGATGKFEFLVGNTPKGGPECDEGGQVAQDRCWWRYGVQTIRHDFKRWVGLVPAKLHYTLDNEWFPINYLREARPDLVSARAHIAWGRVLTATHHVYVALAALACVGVPLVRGAGGARARRRWLALAVQIVLLAATLAIGLSGVSPHFPVIWPVAVLACLVPWLPLPGAPPRNGALLGVVAVALTTLLTHAIFFGEDRYHLVATPAFAILAAGLFRRSVPTAAARE